MGKEITSYHVTVFVVCSINHKICGQHGHRKYVSRAILGEVTKKTTRWPTSDIIIAGETLIYYF